MCHKFSPVNTTSIESGKKMNRQGDAMDFEALWYEYAPYLYAIAGIVMIDQIGSAFGICLGALLLFLAASTLVRRWSHRIGSGRKGSVETD
jgi:ABC-type phosphate/phosphonate transport system permease subunit